MSKINWSLLGAIAVLVGLLAFLYSTSARAHDPSHHELDQWYQSLMMPDPPQISCCGPSDAYFADSFEVSKNGEYVAIITDERDDEPLHREHIDIGTKIIVPNNKLNKDSNPTGHGVIFLSRQGTVYCYIAPGGV